MKKEVKGRKFWKTVSRFNMDSLSSSPEESSTRDDLIKQKSEGGLFRGAPSDLPVAPTASSSSGCYSDQDDGTQSLTLSYDMNDSGTENCNSEIAGLQKNDIDDGNDNSNNNNGGSIVSDCNGFNDDYTNNNKSSITGNDFNTTTNNYHDNTTTTNNINFKSNNKNSNNKNDNKFEYDKLRRFSSGNTNNNAFAKTSPASMNNNNSNNNINNNKNLDTGLPSSSLMRHNTYSPALYSSSRESLCGDGDLALSKEKEKKNFLSSVINDKAKPLSIMSLGAKKKSSRIDGEFPEMSEESNAEEIEAKGYRDRIKRKVKKINNENERPLSMVFGDRMRPNNSLNKWEKYIFEVPSLANIQPDSKYLFLHVKNKRNQLGVISIQINPYYFEKSVKELVCDSIARGDILIDTHTLLFENAFVSWNTNCDRLINAELHLIGPALFFICHVEDDFEIVCCWPLETVQLVISETFGDSNESEDERNKSSHQEQQQQQSDYRSSSENIEFGDLFESTSSLLSTSGTNSASHSAASPPNTRISGSSAKSNLSTNNSTLPSPSFLKRNDSRKEKILSNGSSSSGGGEKQNFSYIYHHHQHQHQQLQQSQSSSASSPIIGGEKRFDHLTSFYKIFCTFSDIKWKDKCSSLSFSDVFVYPAMNAKPEIVKGKSVQQVKKEAYQEHYQIPSSVEKPTFRSTDPGTELSNLASSNNKDVPVVTNDEQYSREDICAEVSVTEHVLQQKSVDDNQNKQILELSEIVEELKEKIDGTDNYQSDLLDGLKELATRHVKLGHFVEKQEKENEKLKKKIIQMDENLQILKECFNAQADKVSVAVQRMNVLSMKTSESIVTKTLWRLVTCLLTGGAFLLIPCVKLLRPVTLEIVSYFGIPPDTFEACEIQLQTAKQSAPDDDLDTTRSSFSDLDAISESTFNQHAFSDSRKCGTKYLGSNDDDVRENLTKFIMFVLIFVVFCVVYYKL